MVRRIDFSPPGLLRMAPMTPQIATFHALSGVRDKTAFK
jgi:hypothetical protein